MPAKFEIYKDKKGEFRFRLKAANGETIATGESYPDKKSVLKGVASVAKNAPVAKIDDTTAEAVDSKKAAKKPAAPPKEKTLADKRKKAAKIPGAKPARGKRPAKAAETE